MKKTAIRAIVILLLSSCALAQQRYNSFNLRVMDEWGNPVSLTTSAEIYIYAVGTETPLTVYRDRGGAFPCAQPITWNSTNTPLEYSKGLMKFHTQRSAFKIKISDGTYTRTLDNCNEATMRVMWPTFGLAVGSDILQAYDADLDIWATLTPSAFFKTLVDDTTASNLLGTLGFTSEAKAFLDEIPHENETIYWDGSDWVESATSSFGRSMWAEPNEADFLSALGVSDFVIGLVDEPNATDFLSEIDPNMATLVAMLSGSSGSIDITGDVNIVGDFNFTGTMSVDGNDVDVLDITDFWTDRLAADANEAEFKAAVNLEIGTDVQAYDPNLTGVAAVNWANGNIVKSTGSGGFAAAADGTDYLAPTRIDDTKGNGHTTYTWSADKSFDQLALKQPIDPNLTAIAGLTTAANKAIYWTGAGTASLYDTTSYMRGLMNNADANNLRPDLELPEINVKDYPYLATGDGSTDDTAAVQAAATAAAGGVLRFPKGTYLIGTTITIPADTQVKGDIGAVLKTSAVVYALTTSGGDCVIEGLKFDGNSKGSGVTLNADHDYLRIADCNFVNCTYADAILGVNTQTHKRIEVIRCQIVNGKDGIYFPGKYGSILVDGCLVDGLTETGAVHGVHCGNNTEADWDEMTNAVVRNCVFRDITTSGVNVEAHAIVVYGERDLISGNDIDTVTNNATSSSGAEAIYHKCYYGKIAWNTIKDGGRSSNGAICNKSSGRPTTIAYNTILEEDTVSLVGIFPGGGSYVLGNWLVGLSGVGIDVKASSSTALDDVVLESNIILNHKGGAAVVIEPGHGGSRYMIRNNIISELLASDGTIANAYGIEFIGEDTDYNDVVFEGNRISHFGATSATDSIRCILIQTPDAGSRILGLAFRNNVFAARSTTLDCYGLRLAVGGPTPGITNLVVSGNDASRLSGHDADGTVPFYITADDAAQCTLSYFGGNTFGQSETMLAWSVVSPTYTVSVDISNAEIKALVAAPKELVAAPGAGKLIEILSVALYLDYSGGALAEPSAPDDLALEYDGGTGEQIVTWDTTGFITAGADAISVIQPGSIGVGAATVTSAANVNKNVVLLNTGEEYTGAGSTSVIRAVINYRIHNNLGL